MEAITTRDLLVVAIVFLFREGLPWLMKIVFPSFYGEKVERRKTADQVRAEESAYRREVEKREFEFKREIAEREIQLKRELAERDTIIDNRNAMALEAMNKYIERIADGLSTMTLQIGIMSREISAIKSEQADYFKGGRIAIQKINAMAKPKTQQKKGKSLG